VVVTAVLLLLSLPVLAGSENLLLANISLIPLSLQKHSKTISFEQIPSDLKEIIKCKYSTRANLLNP
jgi:hypothetical protein